MSFKTVDQAAPLLDRVTLLLWGTSRIGKTTAILKAAQDGDIVYHIAADVPTGARAARDQPHLYGKRFRGDYVDGLVRYREAIAEANAGVRELLAKGIPSSRIWVAVDTWTHLQQKYMTESRKVQVRASCPTVGDNYIRDALVQQDYGIVNGWSNESMQALLDLPCNIIVVAQEKMDGHMAVPVLVGQSLETIRGLLDIHARVIVGQDRTTRSFVCGLSSGSTGGVRGVPGKLNEVEPADLVNLRKKFLAVPAVVVGPAAQPKQ